MSKHRLWSLETAQALLGEVRERTARSVADAEALLAERDRAPVDGREAIEAKLRSVVSRWAREMEALSLDVKGPWLVDFDNGGGYYCWRWPEDQLAFFHGYEDGFGGRTPIQ